MFDIRYHIVSLVAVFLALALGILLGFSLEKQGLLKKQQERLVESIQKDIDSVRSKNSNLQKQLASQKKFETNILPFLTKDKLKDHVVALVFFDDAKSNILKSGANETLKNAGASVLELSLNRRSLKKITLNEAQTETFKNSEYKTIDALAVELSSTPGTVLGKLQEEESVKLAEDSIPINSAVVFAGGNKPSLEEEALAKALNKNRIKTVFIDKTENEYSKVDQFVKAGIDTVDNIDMVYGKISLVYLLLNSDSGHFGVRPSADKLMPAFN